MTEAFDAAGPVDVVEDTVGAGSTDFWGISFRPCAGEEDPTGAERLEHGITLLRA